MSGVVKSVTKVFKKVVDVVKKVLPAALAVGAVVFTGGAALGVLPAWGTAVSGLVSQMGAGSLLSSVLSGAVTQAGYGALMGAATSALTGGNISNGMQVGALGGAVTGGITGGFGGEIDPIGKAITGNPTTAAGAGANIGPAAGGAPSAEAQAQAAGFGTNATGQNTSMVTTAAPTAPGLPSVAAPTAPGVAPANNGLLGPGGWIERNNTLVGNVASGLGTAMLKTGEASETAQLRKDMSEAELNKQREQQAWITGNYAGAGPGLLTQADTAYIQNQPGRPAPAQRFDPRYSGGTWVFNQQMGQVVWVPNQQSA